VQSFLRSLQYFAAPPQLLLGRWSSVSTAAVRAPLSSRAGRTCHRLPRSPGTPPKPHRAVHELRPKAVRKHDETGLGRAVRGAERQPDLAGQRRDVTTCPRFRSIMPGSTARVRSMAARRLTLTAASIWSSGWSWYGAVCSTPSRRSGEYRVSSPELSHMKSRYPSRARTGRKRHTLRQSSQAGPNVGPRAGNGPAGPRQPDRERDEVHTARRHHHGYDVRVHHRWHGRRARRPFRTRDRLRVRRAASAAQPPPTC
jgi:hypothetical protein